MNGKERKGGDKVEYVDATFRWTNVTLQGLTRAYRTNSKALQKLRTNIFVAVNFSKCTSENTRKVLLCCVVGPFGHAASTVVDLNKGLIGLGCEDDSLP